MREADIDLHLTSLQAPTPSLLQAISIVDEKVVWISGHNGSLLRSIDGGQTWELYQHPTGDTLQFRDVYAFDAKSVILMSAGTGPASRIFTFKENVWHENYVMQDSMGFLDCIDFWDDMRGIAYGDAVDKHPFILLTVDGGSSWHRAPTDNMPVAGDGEGGFAASGTCVTTEAGGKAWVATGANGHCRILITEDYGQSWQSVESPLVRGAAAGNTAVSFVGEVGFATGGDLAQPQAYTDNCAFSEDGGATWSLAARPQTKGAFYGGALTSVSDEILTFACGPNGLDYSSDLGHTWETISKENYWAVSFVGKRGYACGKNGRILKIEIQ